MLEPLFWIIRRDLTIAMRRRADVFTTLIFFAMSTTNRFAFPRRPP